MGSLRAICFFWLFLGISVLGTAPSGSAQECPFVLNPENVIPSYSHDYKSDAFLALYDQVGKVVAEFVSNNSLPAYAVAVVHKNQTIYTSGLTSTPFRVASITKTITALGAMMLRDQGLLKLDDPVKKYLPNFTIINPWEKHDTTIRELMAHTAGMPLTLCPFLLTCTDAESEILKQISGMELVRPPWSREPVYSNLGISILGHTWEKATSPSMTWAEFVTDKILKPLDMTGSGVDINKIELATNDNPFAKQDLGWSAPAAQMYSTVDDLAKYLVFLLNGNPALLSKSSIREWTRPTKTFADGKAAYGMPWELRKLENYTDFIITKAGDINGYRTQIAIYPPNDLGIAITTVYTLPFLPGPERLADNLFDVLIPGIQGINQQVLADSYAGVYNCQRTSPIKSPTRNTTVQVQGGNITVEVNATFGLFATLNLPLLTDGQSSQALGTLSLLLKDGEENSFWIGNGPCTKYYFGMSAGPEFDSPNAPDSVYDGELIFNLTAKSITYPAVGAQCTLPTS